MGDSNSKKLVPHYPAPLDEQIVVNISAADKQCISTNMTSFLLPWRVVTISLLLFLNAVTTVAAQQQDDDVDTAVASLLEKLQEQHVAVADPLASPEIETIFFSSSSSQNTSPTATSSMLFTTPPTDIATSSAVAAADPLFSSQNKSCQDPNEMEVIILINSDNYPTEITWTLTNLCDSISTSGGPYSSISDHGRVFQQCIPKDQYEFIIFDANNDGICCVYGNGSYSIVVNGVEVHSGNGEYGSNDTAIIGGSCADNNNDMEEEMPTMSPTAKDTITEAPTTTSSLSSIEESALQPSDTTLSEAATTTTTSSTPVSLSDTTSISMSMATLSPAASSTTTSSASSSLTSITTTASPTNPSEEEEEETGSVVPITTMPTSLSPSSTISTSTTMTTTTLPIPELQSITTPKPYTSSKSSSGFMFDTRTPSSSPTLILYGIEIDMVDSSMILTTTSNNKSKSIRVEVYYRIDNDYHTNHEYEDPTILVNDDGTTSTGDSSSGGGGGGWILWMNVTIVSSGLDLPTYIPQSSIITTATNGNDTEEYIGDNIILTPRTKMGFYIRTNDGPYLRYYHDTSTITSTNNARASYYNDGNIALFAMGTAKRSEWDGTTFYPRTFLGGLHYYESDVPWTSGSEDAVLLPGVGLVTSSPTMVPTSSTEQPTLRPLSEEPTFRPSISVGPTVTIVPTLSPTNRPTMAPIAFNYLSTQFETAKVRSYAGNMFNIKARSSIEISSLGIHTFLTSELNITIYILDGGYSVDTKFDNSANWTMIGANVTVLGIGIGKPTYIPYGSFEPIVLQRKAMLGIYITSDGPYLLSTMGTLEGKPHIANPNLVLYEGCGVRYPYKSSADGGSTTFTPRIGNVVIGYSAYVAPTMAPTMDTVPNLFIGNATFVSDADTYIQKGSGGGGDINERFGYDKQLMVDGSPIRVTLIHFDLSSLHQGIMNDNRAGQYQIVNATLRLYSMDAKAMSGGQVSVIANGIIDEESTTWETSTYGDAEMGIYAGSFRAVWPDKYYEVDVTTVLRSVIGSITSAGDIVIRIGSDESKMVNYRSREDAGDKAPALLVTVAYDADMNKPLARTFGSDPPTMAPTIVPEWEDAEALSDPSDRYFNYDINSEFGPEYWYNAEQDGYYDELRRLEADLDRNRCNDGSAQSPRDLCDTNAECIEFHMPRPRVRRLLMQRLFVQMLLDSL